MDKKIIDILTLFCSINTDPLNKQITWAHGDRTENMQVETGWKI